MQTDPAPHAPRLQANQSVVLLRDPLVSNQQIDPVTCSLAHVDPATERLIVEWPLDVKQVDVDAGDFVFVLVVQPGDAYYARVFRIEVVRRADTDDSPRALLVLRPSGRWQRIDRRRSARVAVPSLAVDGRRYPVTGGMLRFEAVARDISEGGILLFSDQRLLLGDVLEFELHLHRPIHARGRVMRVQSAPAADPPGWLAGCAFAALGPDDVTTISEYVSGHASAQ